MSHFAVLVLTDRGPAERDAVLSRVSELLAPYDEEGEWFKQGSRWDWWQVGGRFTGVLDGYDPWVDARNQETCDVCGGTGSRLEWPAGVSADWIDHCNGCNGCGGTGSRVAWPTQWAGYDRDILAVSEVSTIPDQFVPAAVVTPDGEWHEEAHIGWFAQELERNESPGDWLMVVKRLLAEHKDATAVIVDCHV